MFRYTGFTESCESCGLNTKNNKTQYMSKLKPLGSKMVFKINGFGVHGVLFLISGCSINCVHEIRCSIL